MKKVYVFAFALFLTQVHAPAGLVIDDFSVAQIGQDNTTVTVGGPSIIGGYRDLYQWYSFTADVDHTISGQLYCESSPGTGSFVEIFYNGEGDWPGLAHLDLTESGLYDGLEVFFTSINATGGLIDIRIVGAENEGWLRHNLPAVPQSLFFAFDDFEVLLPCSTDGSNAATSTLDFSDVTFINLIIELDAGGSCAIDSFRVVPEPATLMLLGVGSALLRKRR